jgi:hypothetical protein
MSFLINNFENGAPVTESARAEFGPEALFFYSLEFTSLDSDGGYHIVQSDFFGTATVNKERWDSVEPVRGKRYLAIDLFQKTNTDPYVIAPAQSNNSLNPTPR